MTLMYNFSSVILIFHLWRLTPICLQTGTPEDLRDAMAFDFAPNDP